MYSMTGYGKADFCQGDIEIIAEIKTVNNRYLDINSKMSRALLPLEDKMRKLISSRISRGRVDIYVTLNDRREREKNVAVDTGLLKGYIEAAKMLCDKFEVENDLTVSHIFKLPDVVRAESGDVEINDYEEILSNCVNIALNNLNEMRSNEGLAIKNDLIKKLSFMKEYTLKIKEKAPLVQEEYKNKLSLKIAEALEKVEPDEARLLNEVAFFADRSSIDEELLRLESHYSQFDNILKNKEPSGRKLDFLVQELNREVNTICSKSSDIDITNNALALKSEIEKIREQVQNLE